MKAYLRSVRIAPKKANIIAKMVRGLSVSDAMELMRRTNKKGARIVEKLIASAVANARHNDKQHPTDLVVKSIIVNQSLGYARGVPMARGRIRSMTKFLSHIDLALGIADGKMETAKNQKKQTNQKKDEKTTIKASHEEKNTVKASAHSAKEEKKEDASRSSSESSASSDSSAS